MCTQLYLMGKKYNYMHLKVKEKQPTACVFKQGDVLLKCFHTHTHSLDIDL